MFGERQGLSWLQKIFAARSVKDPPAQTGELAWSTGNRMGFAQDPNPDTLSERWGLELYRRMAKDDQIRALLALKQAVISSRSWRFACDREEQQESAEFFHYLLEMELRGSFRQALAQMLTSQIFGFSLLEKIHEPLQWGARKCWGLRQLKLRPAESFRFVTDPHGNLLSLTQQQGLRTVELPPQRFVHHVNKPEVHPLYGESDLHECHRHWLAKDHILRYWNLYLERMASGFVHGRISGPLSAAEREELQRVMEEINYRNAIITPAGVELRLVTAPSTDAFERAVAARDKAIAKALLVPNLLGFSEQGQTGSYSQSRTQLETFFFVLNGMAESVADTLNEQLFRDLARWNFDLRDPPRFTFDPLTQQQKYDLARTWRESVAGGIVRNGEQDEARIRELLGFPAAPSPAATEEHAAGSTSTNTTRTSAARTNSARSHLSVLRNA